MSYEKFCKDYPDRYLTDVKWGEMDVLGHLNNAHYFRYFECARMVFWDRLENLTRSQSEKKIGPILASTACRFRRPLYYPDKIEIGTRVHAIDDDRFTVGHAIWSEREKAVAAEGDAVIVSFDYELKKKVLIPIYWRSILEAELKPVS